MNKVSEKSFKRIYYIFVSFVLIGTLAALSVTWYYIENTVACTIIVIFTLFIGVVSIGFVLAISDLVNKLIGELNEMIDEAIGGHACEHYEETIVSLLAHKIVRFIDISKSSKALIEKERREIKSFISDISHQTKTPLSNVVMYTELLSEGIYEVKYEKMIENIKGQTIKLEWLLDSLVKMSRLETEMIACNCEANNLHETILKVVNQVFVKSEKKNIEIRINCKSKVQAIYDQKWTVEALVNIVENAIKYTNENGKITIKVEAYELFTKVEIIDNGIGIKQSEVNHIFKRFYRGHNVKDYEGIGIGLYLTREIITKQKGYIQVDSEEGIGSRFSVFLLSHKK